jgi:hypothetical protein
LIVSLHDIADQQQNGNGYAQPDNKEQNNHHYAFHGKLLSFVYFFTISVHSYRARFNSASAQSLCVGWRPHESAPAADWILHFPHKYGKPLGQYWAKYPKKTAG